MSLPSPPEESPAIRPDWLLADLRSKAVVPAALEEFKRVYPACQLFLVAGGPSAPVPVELARLGVRHWFVLPVDADEIRRVFPSRASIAPRRPGAATAAEPGDPRLQGHHRAPRRPSWRHAIWRLARP